MKEGLPAPNKIFWLLKKRKDLIVVVAFTAFVGVIRLPYLGYQSFWYDEAIQVLAAQGIINDGYPFLPSGFLYRRGLLCSYSMAFFFTVFGINEFSARIGSLIFSVLTLPLIYFLGKDLGDKRAGAMGTVIVALSPWAVGWARTARMYAQFQFFSLLTVYFFYKIYVARNQPRHPLKYNILLIISFLCAVFSHELALTLILSLFVSLLFARGISGIKYRSIVIGAVVAGLAGFLFFFVELGLKMPVFQFQLSWLIHDFLSAYKVFFKIYPVLSFLMVIGALVLFVSKDRNLLYLYSNFLVPLNSTPIVTTVTTRGHLSGQHLFFLLPIFVLASCFVLLQLVNRTSEFVTKRISEIISHLNREKVKKTTTWIILAVVIFPSVSNLYVRILIPYSDVSLTEAFSYYQPGHRNPDIEIEDWKGSPGDIRGACEFIEQRYQNGDAIISTQHVSVYYYLQEIISERNVNLFFLRQRSEKEDYYLNSTIIDSLDELNETLYRHKRTWIIVDGHFKIFVEPDVRDFVLENTRLVYEDQEDYLLVYLWP